MQWDPVVHGQLVPWCTAPGLAWTPRVVESVAQPSGGFWAVPPPEVGATRRVRVVFADGPGDWEFRIAGFVADAGCGDGVVVAEENPFFALAFNLSWVRADRPFSLHYEFADTEVGRVGTFSECRLVPYQFPRMDHKLALWGGALVRVERA